MQKYQYGQTDRQNRSPNAPPTPPSLPPFSHQPPKTLEQGQKPQSHSHGLSLFLVRRDRCRGRAPARRPPHLPLQLRRPPPLLRGVGGPQGLGPRGSRAAGGRLGRLGPPPGQEPKTSSGSSVVALEVPEGATACWALPPAKTSSGSCVVALGVPEGATACWGLLPVNATDSSRGITLVALAVPAGAMDLIPSKTMDASRGSGVVTVAVPEGAKVLLHANTTNRDSSRVISLVELAVPEGTMDLPCKTMRRRAGTASSRSPCRRALRVAGGSSKPAQPRARPGAASWRSRCLWAPRAAGAFSRPTPPRCRVGTC
ncbi:uncharacterized protein [Triticum aestivum]|uniref:uncharacterized protein n=1 Tax=Triticum aestivum TaxID=4565 RepID=UPI001D010674|nr:uncharacterized protein LOC123039565 [Triticum aestivum]